MPPQTNQQVELRFSQLFLYVHKPDTDTNSLRTKKPKKKKEWREEQP